MKHTRTNDRCSIGSAAVKPVPEFLEGVWFNTDPGTGEIAKVVISVLGDLLEKGKDSGGKVDLSHYVTPSSRGTILSLSKLPWR